MIVGRVTTGVVMILGALWAPQIANFPSLWQYLQGVLAYITPPIVSCFILGIFWPRANGNGSFAGLMTGFVAAIVLLFAPVDLHFLYIAPLLFILSSAVIVGVSLMGDAPPESSRELVWTADLFEAETQALRSVPWYLNYRVQSIMVLAVTLAVVGMFL